jgi:hypothetical protein
LALSWPQLEQTKTVDEAIPLRLSARADDLAP